MYTLYPPSRVWDGTPAGHLGSVSQTRCRRRYAECTGCWGRRRPLVIPSLWYHRGCGAGIWGRLRLVVRGLVYRGLDTWIQNSELSFIALDHWSVGDHVSIDGIISVDNLIKRYVRADHIEVKTFGKRVILTLDQWHEMGQNEVVVYFKLTGWNVRLLTWQDRRCWRKGCSRLSCL